MSDSTAPHDPGWYSDPSGRGGKAWWNGSAWGPSEYVPGGLAAAHQPAAATTLASATAVAPSTAPTAAGAPRAAPARDSFATAALVSNSTSSSTWAVWSIAFAPLIAMVGTAFLDWNSIFLALGDTTPEVQAAAVLHPAYIATFGGIWLSFISSVVFARIDQKTLRERGFASTFPFLVAIVGGIFYLIGRTATARKQAGGSLAPFWIALLVRILWITIFAFSFARFVTEFGLSSPL